MEECKEVKNNDEQKKESKLPFIITMVIVLLLFLAGLGVYFFVLKYYEDPDIAIAKLINENVKGTAENSYQGYQNSKAAGYVLDDLMLSKESRVILWDSVNDCYLLYDGDKLVYSPISDPSEGYDLWVFVNKVPMYSAFSVYWAGTNTVVKQETEDGKLVDKEYYYSKHVYDVSVFGLSRTYTCTEDECGYSYSVKMK